MFETGWPLKAFRPFGTGGLRAIDDIRALDASLQRRTLKVGPKPHLKFTKKT
jgi:hypothetical protein